MLRTIHPFPARMAPDLAATVLKRIEPGSTVLDPMAGSGTVLRRASELGHRAIGFDVDPLAVLMSRVWTTQVADDEIVRMYERVVKRVSAVDDAAVELPWIDGDEETTAFTHYWFGKKQRLPLRRLAWTLNELGKKKKSAEAVKALDVLRVALSRIVISKDQGASLARDVSHSRPHKVQSKSDFDVLAAFERSVRSVREMLGAVVPGGPVDVKLGDARRLHLENRSVDLVLTSPPYLNAIDYLRGHRLSLIWLGYQLSQLREIRSASIGAERAPDDPSASGLFDDIVGSMVSVDRLPSRHRSMVFRYAEDVYRMMSEIARVLKRDGRAVLVVGNSCLQGVFIKNSEGVVQAGSMVGLRIRRRIERELPESKRYLPPPGSAGKLLGKRMRTETILTFGVR